MTGEEYAHAALADGLQSAITESFRDLVRQEEELLLSALGAPIFARLMVERKQNPLGIEILEHDDIVITTYAGDKIRYEQRRAFIQTRPSPRPLV